MIPKPSISRLCMLFRLLSDPEVQQLGTISSAQIGERLNLKPANVRKDISFLGDFGHYGGAYNVETLKQAISSRFDFDRQKNVCIVGL